MCYVCIFSTITRINEFNTLTKYISCECKCKFDGKRCKSKVEINNVNQ